MNLRLFALMLNVMVLGSLLVLSSCKDNPVEEDDDHAEAEGLVLRSSGVDVVTVREGRVTGEITVRVNTSTDHLTVYFLDHNGNRFQPTEADKDLRWVIADTTVAQIEREAGEKWDIHVHGKKVGQTNVELQLLHAGHVDFRTPPIPIRVTQ